MMAICWDHWTPESWPRFFPFEVCLFFFLVLTGYLITGSLLRERERREPGDGSWRWRSMKIYQIRRGLRILAPYYAALAFAWIVRAPDVGPAVNWYVFHLSNIHIAMLGDWPPGTSHFWSLAMQQQFYLIWPFVLWFLPKRALLPAILLFTALGPVSRYFHDAQTAFVAWPQALTWSCFDFFGIGALLAYAVQRGMSFESPALRACAWAGLAVYLVLYACYLFGWSTYGFQPLQQTALALALCGLIAAAITGFRSGISNALEHSVLQRVGEVSYGIYLFHNLAPLALGKLLPFLWWGAFDGTWGAVVRIPFYAAITWCLTLASWRWIETPLGEMRRKIVSPTADRHPV